MRLSVLPLWWTWAVLAAAGSTVEAAEKLRIESSLDAMGSVYTIVAYGEDRNQLQTAVDLSFEEIKRLDDLLSNYKPRSEWSKVNREASSGPVRVSPELFQLVEACMRYSRASDGAFDITVGPLVRTWGFLKGTGRLPHRAEIRTALTKVGYRNVTLNRDNLTIQYARPGVEMDPGGIGKGYAVDRIVEILRARGISSALVSAGGSSIYAIGAPPSEPKGWSVKIRHPKKAEESVAEVHLRDGSMATSGTSEKFFYSGGKLFSHIFDPRTGYPAAGMFSVSVLAPRAIDSEAWTKPMFILGRSWASQHKPKDLRVFFCEGKPEIRCAWLQ
ncbi:MAG: FAD:protein FMN transferase [Acidobacteria bacterium]|nr:FAD:protein FMN transferase [Acidobacteriota bacterium]